MSKIIIWEQTEGQFAGEDATTAPAPQEELAQTRPEVLDMSEDEYIQFIIDKDVMPFNPVNIRIVEV